MTEKNIIIVINGGIIKQGSLFVKVLSKEEFDRTMSTFEIYFSSKYNGWKSPIIKDKSIKELQDIILKEQTNLYKK